MTDCHVEKVVTYQWYQDLVIWLLSNFSPQSAFVYSLLPLSFISIGDHRLVCLSPSAWTNISFHAAVFHSSILPSGVPYSSLSIISPALPPSRYLAGETVWIQLHWWRSRLKAWLLHTDHWTSICVSTCLYHCCPFEDSLMDWFLSCRAINKLPLPLKYVFFYLVGIPLLLILLWWNRPFIGY